MNLDFTIFELLEGHGGFLPAHHLLELDLNVLKLVIFFVLVQGRKFI